MAFPAVQSRTTGASTAAATSHTVTLPATINSGDLVLIAFTCTGGTGTTVTWDNSTAGAWSNIANNTQGANTRGMLLSKTADGTEGGAALSVSLSVSSAAAWTIWRITGCQGAVEASVATGGTSTVTFSALTPSWGAKDTLWIAVGHINGTPTVTTYSTNYTNATRAAGSSATRCTTESVQRELNASSETPGAWTLSSSNSQVAHTVAIQPAATDLIPLSWTTLL